MNLTTQQKNKVLAVVNCFETGSVAGDYANVTVLKDGTNPVNGSEILQVTYGVRQTTEQSNLRALLELYVSRAGQYAEEIKIFLTSINTVDGNKKGGTMWANNVFIQGVLKLAGADPVMIQCQDEFFDAVYFAPAKKWAIENGFFLPLSMLVIYDSFIQSGKIHDDIRKMFLEVPPAKGGNEKTWISQYVMCRHKWLLTRSNIVVRKTVYRTRCLADAISTNNWDLKKAMMANKVFVGGLNNFK
jgi:chitosanase